MNIESLRPEDAPAALEQALARVPAAQRAGRVQECLQLLAAGVLDARGILVARRGKAIAGVQVCAPLAGAACLFWLPSADDDCVDPLLRAALDWARSIGCKIAQAVALPDETPFAAPLLRHGFQPITHMRQLVHELDPIPREPAPRLRFETFRPALAPLFAAVLERTYQGTLDCPELNGKRTTEEILAGHRGQGKFHADCWWVAYAGAEPIGVVLLVELPDGSTWELAYLGIVPEFRGQGLGKAMTLHALRALRKRLAARLILAVDERNVPALRLYRSLGFVETERNQVLLRFFED